MARKKSYYTVDEITTNLYTFGSEWMLTDGTEYIGLYHLYATGEVYTLASWNETFSQQLLPYRDINQSAFIYQQLSNITTKYKSFVSVRPVINSDALTKGYFYRYIVKKNNEMLFYETTLDDFNKWNLKQIDNNLYTMIKLKWIIRGNLQDTTNAGVIIPSVSTMNSMTIKSAEKTIPGLSLYLTNLTEFYIDSDYIVATDINGLN